MKIVIAPDSFKGSISAVKACEAMEKGVRRVFPEAEVIKMPVADGGEGTVDAFACAVPCEIVERDVTGPLGDKVKARFAVLKDHTAVIEMAAASGLTLINEAKRNPLKTTSYGTGELIKAALDLGCTKVILGLGGSATNDGGVGLAQALGISFLDEGGSELGFGGGGLGRLTHIDCSARYEKTNKLKIIVASDVSNTLCGEKGASCVFGPQKGATEEMVRTLDKNLGHYAKVLKDQSGCDVKDIAGTGAAGGIAASLLAFFNTRIEAGIERILDTIGFNEHLNGADLVLTGEGKVDYQTAFGKVPAGVAARAKKRNIPVIAFAGGIGSGIETLYEMGINSVISITDKPMALLEAMANAEELLKSSVERCMLIFKAGMGVKQR